jgi:hypothetical protein
MRVIGIDPGASTGLGVWDTAARELLAVLSMEAQFLAQDWLMQQFTAARAAGTDVLVVLEDARKSRMGRGGATYGQTNRLQGVGAVKRDSKVWAQFLTHHRIPFVALPPRRSLTKWSADHFRAVTGWTGKTNNHGRDAACLVHGLNTPMAAGLLRDWQQRNPS